MIFTIQQSILIIAFFLYLFLFSLLGANRNSMSDIEKDIEDLDQLRTITKDDEQKKLITEEIDRLSKIPH